MIRGGNKHPTSARGGLAAAEVRGASARAQWIREGLVVLGPQLAQAWGIPQEALATTSASGEVVSIHIEPLEDPRAWGDIPRGAEHPMHSSRTRFDEGPVSG